MRFHRRLRRLPRRVPPEHSTGRAEELRAGISVRLARHPLGITAAVRGAHLRLSRARLRPLQHALADALAALPAVRPRRESRRMARRADMAGAAPPARPPHAPPPRRRPAHAAA